MYNKTNDLRLLVRCSQMYYEEKLSQIQISEKMKISKSSVSRILTVAKKKGIVKFMVVNPLKYDYISIEKQIEKKFSIKEAIIVDCKSNESNEIKNELAKVAAKYLDRVIKNGDIIGVAMGTTLNKIPKYINNNHNHKSNLTFIPLLGGIGQTEIEIHPNQIALNFARLFKSDCKLLHAPFIVDDFQIKEVFIHDKNIKEIFKIMGNVNIALIGIGSTTENTSTMIESGSFSFEDMKAIENEGGVGDVCCMFVDKDGKGDKFEVNRRVIGIELDNLKKIPLKIAVAGSNKKARAISAVLKGGYVDILVVDNKTAEEILKVV